VIILFNLLEGKRATIVAALNQHLKATLSGYDPSEQWIQDTSERLLNGYLDVLVTGGTGAIDELAGTAGTGLAGMPPDMWIFDASLMLSSIIRRILVAEVSSMPISYSLLTGTPHYLRKPASDAVTQLDRTIAETEGAAVKIACRCLDLHSARRRAPAQ
jgi:hypothetical protein